MAVNRINTVPTSIKWPAISTTNYNVVENKKKM